MKKITVAETPEYRKRVAELFSEAEQNELIDHLAAFPKSGVVVRGTGGVRKIRWARQGAGKKTNLSEKERNLLAQLIKNLVQAHKESS